MTKPIVDEIFEEFEGGYVQFGIKNNAEDDLTVDLRKFLTTSLIKVLEEVKFFDSIYTNGEVFNARVSAIQDQIMKKTLKEG